MTDQPSTAVSFCRPAYDRDRLKTRLLHIGFGAFARAHLAVYLDATLAKTAGDWGICAVRLHSGADELAALEKAGCLYQLAEADDDSATIRTIGAVCATLHPKTTDVEAFYAPFVSADLSIISLTVTEKGYCTDGRGNLDIENPAIQRDLRDAAVAQTAVGVIVEGLRRRRATGVGGLSVMSCDNLPENGQTTQNVICAFAGLKDADLAQWIAHNVTFPSTMVDRIVPALTKQAEEYIAGLAGGSGANDIVCEPFRQWVIEDNFIAGRPDFDLAGAQFVENVAPFEDMKLRMLNGSHSFLAYLGALAGYETVSDCMKDKQLRGAARALMVREQIPTLSMPEGTDLEAYADDLLKRFENTRLKHKTTQIASDGSQKLPQRMLNSINHHLRHGTPWHALCLGVAAWMAYARGQDENGAALPLADPLAQRIRSIVADQADGPDYVRAMLQLDTVFPVQLANDPGFQQPLITAYQRLRQPGVHAALADLEN